MLRASALSFLLWLSAAYCLPAQSIEKAVDQIMRESLKVWDVPGAAVVIVQNDKTLLAKGYGKRALGGQEPVDQETIFPLGSCSKSFLAVALGILADDGKLRWDDPVRKHLPDFHLSDQNADALVTIRDLVSHRTGVGGYDLLWYRAPWSQQESVRRLERLPQSGPFRSSFYYSTLQFMAAGEAANKYCPRGWPELARERILSPLQMTKTTFTSTDALRTRNHAGAHRPNRDGKLEKIDWYPQTEPHEAGSVYTNAADLAKWLQFQLGDGSWKGRRIVTSANVAETHKPNTLIPMNEFNKAWNPHSVQLSYAMGWVVQDYRGVPMLLHGGIIDGFKSMLVLLPEQGIGIGILANHHATNMNLAVANQIVDLLLDAPAKDWNAYYGALVQAEETAKKEAAARRERERNPDEKPSRPLAEYAGVYEHPALGECRVEFTEGQLHWHWSSFQHVLEPYRHDTFEFKDIYMNDPLVEFVVENNEVRGMKFMEMAFCKKK